MSEHKGGAARVREQVLEQALEQSPTTVMLTDLQGRIEYVNPTFQSLTGYGPDEVLGRNARLLNSGFHPKAFFRELWQTLIAGQSWRGEIVNRKKNGELYWEKAIISPVLEPQGKVTGYLAIKEDITEYKRSEEALRESEQRYKELVEHQGEGFCTVDLEERFEFVNPAAEKILGVPPGTLNGRLMTEFLLGGSLGRVQDQSRLRLGGESSSYEVEIRRADGVDRTLLVTATPKVDGAGRSLGAFGVFRDITERKGMEEALREAKIAAETANVAKSAFLANLSHEIRTPINGVLGFLHLLGETALTDQQKDYLDKAGLSALDLHGILTDILDFSKLEAQRVQVERVPFALGEVLDNLAGQLRGKALEKGLELAFEVEEGLPPALLGDPLRLGQVLRNLLTNALKFTVQGEVKLTVRSLPAAEGLSSLSFQVADTGIGMAESELGRLFQPFTQGDASTIRRFGGIGLGLAIAGRLVELMGGGLEVASRPGEGSTFTLTLTLPLVESLPGQAVCPAPQPGGAKALNGLAVLLVEDNPLNRQLGKVILQRAGAVVTLALDGAEAVACARTGAFDVLLMDLRMPVMSGYEATALIRQMDLEVQPLIIAVTADAVVEVRARVLAAGMDDCLTKPLEPGPLVQAVARRLRRGRAPEGSPAIPELQTALEPAAAAAGPLDREAVATLSATLRRLLEADEAQARKVFVQLEAVVRGGPLAGVLAPLRRPIEIYDYAEALSLLKAFTEAVSQY